MSPLEIAVRYFDAWNKRDPAAVVSTFALGGTYNDPTTSGDICANAIANHVQDLCNAFPDVAFEIVSAAEAGPGRVAVQWLMTGTNLGSYQGWPPTGKPVCLPGAGFFEVEGTEIRLVRGYFDTRVIPEQTGLRIVVQAHKSNIDQIKNTTGS